MTISCSELISLIRCQAALLEDIAQGRRTPEDAKAEYQRQHIELRQHLGAEGLPCFCPWSNVYAWPGMVANRGGDWRALLDELLAPLTPILGDGPTASWTIAFTEVFQSQCFTRFSDQQQTVLDQHFKKELAIFGLELLDNRSKLEAMDCPGRNAGNVLEYKVEAKGVGEKIMLRVFLQTLPNHTLVPLWGYDKAANPSKSFQNAQRDKACGLRLP